MSETKTPFSDLIERMEKQDSAFDEVFVDSQDAELPREVR